MLVLGVLKSSGAIEAMSGLAAWISALEGRLARHELAHLGPITLRDGSRLPDTELTVRIMLADLQHHDTLPAAERQDVRVAQSRHELLADFRYLRALLG
jgi:hypothetical protein